MKTIGEAIAITPRKEGIVNIELSKQSSWALLVLFGCLLMGISRLSYADTYNIYLKKSDDKVSIHDGEEEEKKEPKKETPPPQKPAEATKSDAPVVIHNHNYVNTSPSQGEPMPPGEAQLSVEARAAQSRATVTAYPTSRNESHIRFGMALVTGIDSKSTYYDVNGDPYGNYPGVGLGLNLQLGIFPKEYFGINLIGGADVFDTVDGDTYYGIAELHVLPFRVQRMNYDLFQAGIMVGTDTRLWESTDTPIFLGPRLNINVNESYGFTTALRIGDEYLSIEGGFVMRL